LFLATRIEAWSTNLLKRIVNGTKAYIHEVDTVLALLDVLVESVTPDVVGAEQIPDAVGSLTSNEIVQFRCSARAQASV
jgi:hypothetical protein